MPVYKDRSVSDELLSKLELFESSDCYKWPLTIETAWEQTDEQRSKSVHSDNYVKLYDIIDENKNNYDNLLRIRNILSDIIDKLSKNRNFIETDYDRYKYNRELYSLRLDILRLRLKGERLNTCQHDYLGMEWLPKFGCKYVDIKNLTDYRDGTPDFRAVSSFGNEWEVKIVKGNVIYFTRLQLERFKKDVNILIFKTVRYSSRMNTINNIGCEFHNHIKFSDIYDAVLGNKNHFQHKFGDRLLGGYVTYKIHVADSEDSAKHILENRYRS